MYLTRGQVGGLRNAGSPELSFSPPRSSSQPPEWGRPGSLPGISPYQAHDAPVHPDLTVALANPIKYFNAQDKKSVKLKEDMGGPPEVCVAGSIARGPQELCLLHGKIREGEELPT